MTVEWFGRQMTLAGKIGAGALRRVLERSAGLRDRRRFVCRAEEILDESCPQFEDRFLCVRMSGCIPVAQANLDTDVRLELLDITNGPNSPEPVLSASPQWHQTQWPVFFYQTHNGVIPCKDAVLADEITVAKIPLHLLRFAYRGRRKIQVVLSILACSDGQVVVSAHDCVEYVFCREGFIELQERRENVLKASVELACAAAAGLPFETSVVPIVERWIQDKTRRFTPRTDLAEPLRRLQAVEGVLDADTACECLLTWGQKADRMAAADLTLQVVAQLSSLPRRLEEQLWAMAETLEISHERFLSLCQKRLLTVLCPYERWRLLMGVRDRLSPEDLRCRLNEEYRKWNARVTHRDPEIRRQADTILSLIADVRNRQQKEAMRA